MTRLISEFNFSDLTASALNALRDAGCGPNDPTFTLNFDGQLHRFRVDGDKAGSKNGWAVFYGDGIPAGAFGSWKSGVSETWCAKGDHELSSAEKALRDQHLANAKTARQRLETQVHDHARQRAIELNATARDTVAADHPYLVKKGIPAIGIRQLQQTLVIPIHDLTGTLHSLQFIGPDGGKRFLTGGAISGHFALIGSLQGAETLLIAEGYATAVSLHQATGFPVACAFNAGNLLPVAQALRGAYPTATLVICADDDQWTDGNPGLTQARQAAEAVRGFVISPQFERIDDHPTDFNDLQQQVGMTALKAQLSAALAGCQPEAARREALERLILETEDFETLIHGVARQIADSELPKPTISFLLKKLASKVKVPVADLRELLAPASVNLTGWKAGLRYEDDGRTIKLTLANLTHILNAAPEWRNALVLDQFSMDILKRRSLPFASREAVWSDLDSSKTRIWLESAFDLSPTTLLVDEAIQVVGDQHTVHVVREYLDSLTWDGKPRLKQWPLRYLGAEDNAVHRFVGQAWMVGAVKRVFEPGCKFDNLIVLEGPQGAGKSTALAILGGEWHAESITDVGSKDSLMLLRGKWIVEFAELDALGRVESSRIKQHVSAPSDTYRPPYGRRTITVPRQGVFAATCNPQQYLRDETGGRRFWPIRCGLVDTAALRRDRDQLWAEATALYRQGEQTWATAEMKYLTEAQDGRFSTDPWEELLIEHVLYLKEVSIMQIMDHLLIEKARQTQADKNRIAKILSRLGFSLQVTRRNGVSMRVYRKE